MINNTFLAYIYATSNDRLVEKNPRLRIILPIF